MAIRDIEAEPAAQLIEAARGLAPRIAGAGDEIEKDRRLPQWLVDAMVRAGLFRMLVPASLGGAEVDPITFSEVIEVIAEVDGSTAWCLGQGGGSAHIAGSIERETAQAIFGDGTAIIAWGPGAGSAAAVDGGYRITGKWPFASGCHHATWMGGTARIVNGDGSPRLRADGTPEVRRMLFPASAPEIRRLGRQRAQRDRKRHLCSPRLVRA